MRGALALVALPERGDFYDGYGGYDGHDGYDGYDGCWYWRGLTADAAGWLR